MLFYLSSDFSSSFEFEPVDYLRFVFQLERHVDLRIGSAELSIDPRQAGYVLPVGLPAPETHPDGYRSLALRICPKRLQCLEHSPTKLKHLVVQRMLQVNLLEQPLFDQVDST